MARNSFAVARAIAVCFRRCLGRHRHQEFLAFLRRLHREFPPDKELHLLLANYGTYKHPDVETWLANHPRFTLHFTSTSRSWLTLVERWFAEITQKRIRRGVFHSATELEAAINEHIAQSNQEPKPFVWTATVEKIMAKIAKRNAVYETIH